MDAEKLKLEFVDHLTEQAPNHARTLAGMPAGLRLESLRTIEQAYRNGFKNIGATGSSSDLWVMALIERLKHLVKAVEAEAQSRPLNLAV